MKVLVSACLLGENCKYNGSNNFNQKVVDFLKANNYEIIPVCPEVLGKLPTPRIPSEIVNGVVTNKQGIIVDKEFRLGAKKAMEIVISKKVELAILKANSPSCGLGKIYDGTFSGTLIEGDGIFAEKLKNTGIKIITEKDV